MSLNDRHYEILDIVAAGGDLEWQVVPMSLTRKTGSGWNRADKIPGRRAALKKLSDLGLLHVRTVTLSAWYSPLSDPPVDGYERVEVQAMLSPQGRDIALSRRAAE